MTQKETDRAGRTHVLEMAVGRDCQDTETNRPSMAHSPTGDGRVTGQNTERNRPTGAHSLSGDRRGRGLLIHRKKPTE